MQIPKNIQARMAEKGVVNQKELAKKCHITEATLSRYLHKQRKISAENLFKISKVLDMPAEELYESLR